MKRRKKKVRRIEVHALESAAYKLLFLLHQKFGGVVPWWGIKDLDQGFNVELWPDHWDKEEVWVCLTPVAWFEKWRRGDHIAFRFRCSGDRWELTKALLPTWFLQKGIQVPGVLDPNDKQKLRVSFIRAFNNS